MSKGNTLSPCFDIIILLNNLKYNKITKKKRKFLGSQIVAWYRREGKALNYTMKRMYVLKKNCSEGKRGDKLFKKPINKSREIFFYEKETRESLRKIIAPFDIPCKFQIGFTRNKGIQDILEVLNYNIEGETFIKVDLKDAFNSITTRQIEELLRYVYCINPKLSKELATSWTHNGHMCQGHPLSPAIFNLLTRATTERIGAIDSIDIVQYADDILIIDKKFKRTSYGFAKHLVKMYHRIGFKGNVEKNGFYHSFEKFSFLGCRLSKENVVSNNRRKYKSLIRRELWLSNMNSPKVLGLQAWKNFEAKTLLARIRLKITKSKIHRIPKKDRWILWSNPCTIPESLKVKYGLI